jgi:hypothetical protein
MSKVFRCLQTLHISLGKEAKIEKNNLNLNKESCIASHKEVALFL